MENLVKIYDATLYHADCRDVIPMLEGVDVVITDPPYAVSVVGSKSIGPRGTRNLDFFPGDSDWEQMNASVRTAVQLCVLLHPKTFVAWCGHRQIGFMVEILEESGYSTRLLSWIKECPPPAAPGAGFSSAFETAVYGYLPGRPWNGGQYEFNVFRADSYRFGQPGKENHPTQKPISLIEWNVSLLSSPADVVLDAFMGSGTTGVACASLGRKFIGIEREKKYFDIACKRIEIAYAQEKLPFDSVSRDCCGEPMP